MLNQNQVGLTCRKLTKSYGGRVVLNSVDLSLRPGSILGLVGENGAGKSTINSIIAGVIAPEGGEMVLDGAPYAPASPFDAMRKGVALIHQEIRLLPELTVAENIFLGRFPMRRGRIDRNRMAQEAHAVLDALGAHVDPKRTVSGLSMSTQQEIEIAKAIMRNPRYIIFDEPTASLGEAEAAQILAQIRKLKAQGAGIIYVSHRLDEIQEIADEVMCLRDGDRVAYWETGPFTKQDMINAMVGRDFSFGHRAPPPRGDRVAIRVDGISRGRAFQDISFEVTEGEIFGIAGLVGAGRTEVVRAIAGADRFDSGEIRVDNTIVKYKKPRGAIKAGIFMVPEDRKGQGLHLTRTPGENLILPWEKMLLRHGMITSTVVDEVAQKQKQRFDIRGNLDEPVGQMSGGNQQKVLIAKWLVENPKVFILDEPTRGVDVGAKMAIYDIIRKLAAEGVAVILVSSELEEVLGLSHRVLVMSEGRQRGILSRDEANPAHVMSLAVPAKYNFDQTKLLKPITRPLNFVFIPKLVHPWYKDVEYGARAAIEEFHNQGIKIHLKWDPPPTADIHKQIKKIEANVKAKPDGIAVACLDSASATRIIDDAVDSGLNVITFDVDAPDTKRLAYIGHNGDYQDGFDAGELIAKKIGGKGKVGLMTGSPAAPNHVQRVQGFKAAMANYKDISIVFEESDNDDYKKALDLAESALQAHPDMAGFYGCSPGNLIGMGRVVKKAGLTGKIVLVGDAVMPETIELISNDVIYLANAQRHWEQGYWAVKYLVAINQGHTYPVVHETGAMPVTKDDLLKWGMIK